MSSSDSALDQDTRIYSNNPGYPVRSTESFIELTYQAQVSPWWTIQPDFQYVFTPGGGVQNPDAPADVNARMHNEAVLGVRTGITF